MRPVSQSRVTAPHASSCVSLRCHSWPCVHQGKITAVKSHCASYMVYPHPQEAEISVAWETSMMSAAPFLCVCHIWFCFVRLIQAVSMTSAFAWMLVYWWTFVVSPCCNTSGAVVTWIEVWSRSPDSCVVDLLSHCLCRERLFTFSSFHEAFLVYSVFWLLFQKWLISSNT